MTGDYVGAALAAKLRHSELILGKEQNPAFGE